MELQELRDAGLSAAKASYVIGMAKHFQDGLLNESDIAGEQVLATAGHRQAG